MNNYPKLLVVALVGLGVLGLPVLAKAAQTSQTISVAQTVPVGATLIKPQQLVKLSPQQVERLKKEPVSLDLTGASPHDAANLTTEQLSVISGVTIDSRDSLEAYPTVNKAVIAQGIPLTIRARDGATIQSSALAGLSSNHPISRLTLEATGRDGRVSKDFIKAAAQVTTGLTVAQGLIVPSGGYAGAGAGKLIAINISQSAASNITSDDRKAISGVPAAAAPGPVIAGLSGVPAPKGIISGAAAPPSSYNGPSQSAAAGPFETGWRVYTVTSDLLPSNFGSHGKGIIVGLPYTMISASRLAKQGYPFVTSNNIIYFAAPGSSINTLQTAVKALNTINNWDPLNLRTVKLGSYIALDQFMGLAKVPPQDRKLIMNIQAYNLANRIQNSRKPVILSASGTADQNVNAIAIFTAELLANLFPGTKAIVQPRDAVNKVQVDLSGLSLDAQKKFMSVSGIPENIVENTSTSPRYWGGGKTIMWGSDAQPSDVRTALSRNKRVTVENVDARTAAAIIEGTASNPVARLSSDEGAVQAPNIAYDPQKNRLSLYDDETSIAPQLISPKDNLSRQN